MIKCANEKAIGYVSSQTLEVEDSLWSPIYGGSREAGDSICHHCGISPLEENSQTTPEVGDGLSLQLASVSGQCTAQLLHLSLRGGMPPSHGLGNNWEESNTLSQSSQVPLSFRS